MSYPTKILPNVNNKIVSCDISKHFLIRFTNSKNIEDILDVSTSFVKDEHICSPSEQAQDLSTNLLGVFEIPHIYIQLTDVGKTKYNQYCDPDISADVPLLGDDYILNVNRHYWVVPIKSIDNQIADYSKNNMPLKASAKVCHTPMKWNFWHFSIRWFLNSENCCWHELPENEKKKGWTKRLAHEAKALIKQFARVQEPNYSELSKECYTKP